MRLLIIACSAAQRSDSNPMAAYWRYDGPAYRVLRANCPSRTRILILSARYGLIHWRTPIDYIVHRMTYQRAIEIAGDPASRNLLLVSLPYATDTFFFGGRDYRRCINLMSEGIRHSAPITYSSGGIGVQLQQLKQWLLDGSSAHRVGSVGGRQESRTPGLKSRAAQPRAIGEKRS